MMLSGLTNGKFNIQCGAVITRSILSKILTKDPPNSSPIRGKYGVSFVSQNSDLVNASVIEVLQKIACNIGLCYNDTWS